MPRYELTPRLAIPAELLAAVALFQATTRVRLVIRTSGLPAHRTHAAYATVDGEVRIEPTRAREAVQLLPAAIADAERGQLLGDG